MRIAILITMLAVALTLALSAGLACGGARPAPAPPSPSSTPREAAAAPAPPTRQEVLVALTDTVIVPRYREAAGAMNDLSAALDALCAAPAPDGLAAARTAWRTARASWLRTQAAWFGPVMERRSRSLVDWSPVDPPRIEQTLSSRDAISPEVVREFLGASQRGLGAMEYILYGSVRGSEGAGNGDAAADDAEVLDALSGPASIRCQYLTALGVVADAETEAVLVDWAGDNLSGKAYAGYFNGTASSSLLGKAAVDELVRTSVFLTRNIADMRLGKALGMAPGISPDADGGAAEPAALRAGPAHNTVADFRSQVLGMQDIYQGGDNGPGLSGLVRGLSPAADDRMRASFAAVLAAIDDLPEPLPAAILDNPEPARRAYQQMQDFQRILNTEVVSLLGVSVGFADTDGDGG